MNKYWIILVIILVVAGVYIVSNRDSSELQSQVLQDRRQGNEITDTGDCLKMAEDSANDCLLNLAVEEKDAVICDKISKASKKMECKREVELEQ